MTPYVLVPFPDGAQLEFVYSMGTVVFENKLWMLNRQPPTTQAQLDALAAAAAVYWAANMLPLQSNEVTLSLVRATAWDDPGSPVVGFVVPALAGLSTSPTQSANVAIWVGFEGPSNVAIYRNGNFFGGVPSIAVNVNTIDPVYASDLFEAYVGIIDEASSWGAFPAWRWSVVSLVSGGALRSSMFARRVVSAHPSVPYVTQRRMRLT